MKGANGSFGSQKSGTFNTRHGYAGAGIRPCQRLANFVFSKKAESNHYMRLKRIYGCGSCLCSHLGVVGVCAWVCSLPGGTIDSIRIVRGLRLEVPGHSVVSALL